MNGILTDAYRDRMCNGLSTTSCCTVHWEQAFILVVERFAKGLALISAKPLADSCFPALNFYVTRETVT